MTLVAPNSNKGFVVNVIVYRQLTGRTDSGGGNGGHTIQVGGTPFPQQPNLNFINAFGINNVGNLSTDIILASYQGTSVSSLTIGSGTQILQTQGQLGYQENDRVTVTAVGSESNYFVAKVDSYNPSTGALNITEEYTWGSGTFSNWQINLGAVPGIGFDATSSTSFTPNATNRTITIDQTSSAWRVNAPARFVSRSSSAEWVQGIITAVSAQTLTLGVLEFNTDSGIPSNDWIVTPARGFKGEPGDRYSTSSSDAITLPLTPGNTQGAMVELGLAYVVGQELQFTSRANIDNNFIGSVLSYSAGSGILSLEIVDSNGAGTYSDWDVGLTGVPGPKGDKGDPGPGVIPGGNTDQIYAKASPTDFDGKWIDPPSGVVDLGTNATATTVEITNTAGDNATIEAATDSLSGLLLPDDFTYLNTTLPSHLGDNSIHFLQSQITTVGTIGFGIWQGTPIADPYIASSATWNAKLDAVNLGYTASPTNGVITNDAGSNATIPLGNGINAGLLDPANFTYINTDVPNHIASTNNPHSVNKSDVGLGSVDNIQQQPLDSDLTAIANLSTLGLINRTADGAADTIPLSGNANEYLDGSGGFSTPSGGGGTPGGSNTQLQFNNNGAFGGIPTFTWNGTDLKITNTNSTGPGLVITEANSQSSPVFEINNSSGTSLFTFEPTGNLTATTFNGIDVTNAALTNQSNTFTHSPQVFGSQTQGGGIDIEVLQTPRLRLKSLTGIADNNDMRITQTTLGYLRFAAHNDAGSNVSEMVRIYNQGGVTVGGATGDNIGAGTINVSGGYYVNGVLLSPGGGSGITVVSDLPGSPSTNDLVYLVKTNRQGLYRYNGTTWRLLCAEGDTWTVYVDAAGSDDPNLGDGAGAAAFATLNYAIDFAIQTKVPGRIVLSSNVTATNVFIPQGLVVTIEAAPTIISDTTVSSFSTSDYYTIGVGSAGGAQKGDILLVTSGQLAPGECSAAIESVSTNTLDMGGSIAFGTQEFAPANNLANGDSVQILRPEIELSITLLEIEGELTIKGVSLMFNNASATASFVKEGAFCLLKNCKVMGGTSQNFFDVVLANNLLTLGCYWGLITGQTGNVRAIRAKASKGNCGGTFFDLAVGAAVVAENGSTFYIQGSSAVTVALDISSSFGVYKGDSLSNLIAGFDSRSSTHVAKPASSYSLVLINQSQGSFTSFPNNTFPDPINVDSSSGNN